MLWRLSPFLLYFECIVIIMELSKYRLEVLDNDERADFY